MIENLQHISHQKKYHELNPISRVLINNFFKSFQNLLPVDCTTILDAGCGEGINLSIIQKNYQNADLFGVDIDMERLQMAKALLPHAQLQASDIYQLPFKHDYFDLTLCNEVLEHIPDYNKALNEIHRVTKKYALISVPREPLWRILNMMRGKYWSDFGNTPTHVNNWSANEFKRLLSQKFRILKSEYPIPWQFYLLEKRL